MRSLNKTDRGNIGQMPTRPFSRSLLIPIIELIVFGLVSGSTYAQSAEASMQVATRVVDNCLMQVKSSEAAVVTSYACPFTAVAPTITLSTVIVTLAVAPGKTGPMATSGVIPEKSRIRVSTITRPNGMTGSRIQPTILPSMEGQNALMTLTY